MNLFKLTLKIRFPNNKFINIPGKNIGKIG